MKDEKKVKATEEVKTEEQGVQLTDEELASVSGGAPSRLDTTPEQTEIDGHRRA